MFKRNKVKAVCVLSPLLTLLWATGAQAGATASITITATIVNRTCTANWTDDPTKTDIKLGEIDAATMTAKGIIGGSREFTLTLTDCSNVNKVKVTASGTPSDEDSTDFKNNGDAAHIGLYIKGGPDESVTLHPDGSGEGDYTVSNGTVAMNFKAIVERTSSSDAPTAGSIKVPVTLKMNYE
ncbi:fimbrial protein [Pantoea sp. RRHST58]|uniref:fimbrial protein n=1 Tax=Pantoea sp. RRHST58 TaxID=3425183 RepID=UPI003DA11022